MKVLFTPITSSSIAHIVRSFAIAQRFRDDGHQVYFTSCDLKKDFIKNYGFEVVQTYKPFNLNDESDQSVNYLSSHKDELVGWFKAEIEAANMVDADVIINSPAFFGPHVYFATGRPVVALMNGQYPSSSKGLMGISMATDSLKDRLMRTVMKPVFNRQFIKTYLSEVLDAYRILGIKNDIKTRDDLYSPMDILIPGDDEFEPQEKMSSNTRFVGPIFWDGFEKMNGELSDESIERFKGRKRLVFITFGGSVFDMEIYKRIFAELEKIDAKKIVALGPNFDRSLFPPDSDDLMVRNFVPGLRISKYADVVVNTGSQGAIMQALVSGTPVVSFPVGIDQSYFANRLEEMTLGINVNKTNLLGFSKRESYQFVDNRIPESMVIAIDKIFSDTHYSQNAVDFACRAIDRHLDPVSEVVNYVYKKYK